MENKVQRRGIKVSEDGKRGAVMKRKRNYGWMVRFLKRHADKIEIRRVAHKRRVKRERACYHQSQIRKKKLSKIHKSVKWMKVPAFFSISENLDETMKFLNDLQNDIPRHRVILQFKDVYRCDPDALLYLKSVTDKTIISFGSVDIAGDLPDDLTCRESFIESGFFDFMSTKPAYWHPHTSDRILTIKEGTKTKPIDACAVVDFVRRHVEHIPHDFLCAFYKTLVEMMTNTRAHAFRIRDKSSKWYVMAKVDENGVQVVFMDGGLGIPETLHKNFFEKCARLLQGLTNSNTDTILLRSALDGAFRTQTQETYRGKGMPAIDSFSKRSQVKDFLLLSRRGVINYSKNRIELSEPFSGTLYEWLICAH